MLFKKVVVLSVLMPLFVFSFFSLSEPHHASACVTNNGNEKCALRPGPKTKGGTDGDSCTVPAQNGDCIAGTCWSGQCKASQINSTKDGKETSEKIGSPEESKAAAAKAEADVNTQAQSDGGTAKPSTTGNASSGGTNSSPVSNVQGAGTVTGRTTSFDSGTINSAYSSGDSDSGGSATPASSGSASSHTTSFPLGPESLYGDAEPETGPGAEEGLQRATQAVQRYQFLQSAGGFVTTLLSDFSPSAFSSSSYGDWDYGGSYDGGGAGVTGFGSSGSGYSGSGSYGGSGSGSWSPVSGGSLSTPFAGNTSGVYCPSGAACSSLGNSPVVSSPSVPSGVPGISLTPPANLTPSQQLTWTTAYTNALGPGCDMSCASHAADLAVQNSTTNTNTVAGYLDPITAPIAAAMRSVGDTFSAAIQGVQRGLSDAFGGGGSASDTGSSPGGSRDGANGLTQYAENQTGGTMYDVPPVPNPEPVIEPPRQQPAELPSVEPVDGTTIAYGPHPAASSEGETPADPTRSFFQIVGRENAVPASDVGSLTDLGGVPDGASPFGIRAVPDNGAGGVLAVGSLDGASGIWRTDSFDLSNPEASNAEVGQGPSAYYGQTTFAGDPASAGIGGESAPPASGDATPRGTPAPPSPDTTQPESGDRSPSTGPKTTDATPPAAGPAAVNPPPSAPGVGGPDATGRTNPSASSGGTGAGGALGLLNSVLGLAKSAMGGQSGQGSGGSKTPTTPVQANPETVLATPVPSTQFPPQKPLTDAPQISVVANPNPVDAGAASTISWRAQWAHAQNASTTRECAVADVTGAILVEHGAESGSVETPVLTHGAYYLIGCKQSDGKLGSTKILVSVKGDTQPPVAPPSLSAAPSTSDAATDLQNALYGAAPAAGAAPAPVDDRPQPVNVACDPNSSQYFSCLTGKMQFVDKLY